MRLRSSQFVFLLLLACSVQMRDDRALRIMTAQTRASVQLQEVTDANVGFGRASTESASVTNRLGAHEMLSERTVWAMPQPAASAASVNSFTGMLRT